MIGVVIINYFNHNEVFLYIEKYLKPLLIEARIVIVDNSADLIEHEKLVELVKDDRSIDVIKAPENLGYAKGNNLGVKHLLGSTYPRYVLFSNTDIVIEDKEVLRVLVEKLEKNKKIAACNPRIVSCDRKTTQTPFRFVPFYQSFVLKKICFPFFKRKIESGLWSDLIEDAGEGCYYRLSGAFLLVRTSSFCQAGMFDEKTFLFAEEAILSERLKRIGLKCGFFPGVEIIHQIHGNIDKFNSSEKISKLMLRSNYYYQRKYMGLKKLFYPLGYLSWLVYYKVYGTVYYSIKKWLK
ncbi:glycosyltransferase family 2 protein [bacterium]|nr:glycosyltransferase family 2 protein [bacterium]